MTPAQKAKELVEKFRKIIVTPSLAKNKERGKACALICVEEMIQEYNRRSDEGYVTTKVFWQQVQEEIKKL